MSAGEPVQLGHRRVGGGEHDAVASGGAVGQPPGERGVGDGGGTDRKERSNGPERTP